MNGWHSKTEFARTRELSLVCMTRRKRLRKQCGYSVRWGEVAMTYNGKTAEQWYQMWLGAVKQWRKEIDGGQDNE